MLYRISPFTVHNVIQHSADMKVHKLLELCHAWPRQQVSKYFTFPLKLIEPYGALSSAVLVKTTSCLTNNLMGVTTAIHNDREIRTLG